MKLILKQLRAFVSTYSILHWLVLILFCGISVYCNYVFEWYKSVQRIENPVQEYFAYVLLYLVHTVFAYLLYSVLFKDFSYWKKPGFVVLLLLSFGIFAFRAVVWQHNEIIRSFSSIDSYPVNRLVYNDLFRLLYLVVPICIVWLIVDRRQMPLYGISVKEHKTTLYLWLLFCMVPLIIGASMLSDFLDYYPRFKKLYAVDAGLADILMFEFCYGLDFTSIELFFRGFMVMAFIRYVGIHAVLPMAAFYLSIHYGKPMGEAISSFFGGTILGVISFYSRSIFGGIMVHVGIAWLMELGAWIGNYLQSSN